MAQQRIARMVRALITGLLAAGVMVTTVACGVDQVSKNQSGTSDTQDVTKDQTATPGTGATDPDSDPDAAGSDATTGDLVLDPASQATFQDNPTVRLPDKIAATIPGDAEFITRDDVQTADGTVLEAATGTTVTDPAISGTEDTPPDPLDKTDGEKFIPVRVSEVRQEIVAANKVVKSAE